MQIKILKVSWIILLLTQFHATSAQSSESIKSILLYTILKHMEWPNELGPEFNITVLGENAVYSELVKISKTRKIGKSTLIIKQASSLKKVDTADIIIIGNNNNYALSEAVEKFTDSSTLIVTDKEGLIEQGADLNFVLRGDKINFQLNEPSVKKKGIKVSSSLISLADKS